MFNILIRQLSIEDASISFHWRNDPEIWQYAGNRPNIFITEEIERNWLAEKLTEKNSSRFAIIVNGQYIGNIQITDIIERDKGQYHIFIGEKSFWGKGIAKQATVQIIRFAKEKLNLKELYLIVNPSHVAAIKLYEKSGFVKVNDEIRMSLNLFDFNPPIVSVLAMTYNHELYIAQALEGILMQKTNFDFDIVVGEDCSTDNTRKIVLEYADKYPGKFKLLLHEHNIGAIANQIAVIKSCTGKYIAICEGDDYWTDPLKLQKQVDFLEANNDYSMCYHRVNELFMNGRCLPDIINKSNKEQTFTIYDLARANFIHTPSVIFRKDHINKLPNWFNESPVGDYPLHMLNAKYGKIKYLPELMAVYRNLGQGTWSPLTNYERIKKWMLVLKLLLIEFEENAKASNILTNQLLKTYSSLENELINGNVPIHEFELITSKLIHDIPSFRSLWFNKCYFTKSKYSFLYVRSTTNAIRRAGGKLIRAIRNLNK